MQICEGVQLMHQPFGVNPAQSMTADGELAGIIPYTQYHGIAEEAVGLDAAPLGAFGGDQYRIGCGGQGGETEPVEVSRAGGLIGEDRFRLPRQTGDQRRGQSAAAHVFERRANHHEVGMAGA